MRTLRDMKLLSGMLLAALVWCVPAAGGGAEEAPANVPPETQAVEAPTGTPRIRFLSETENLGDIAQGESGERVFVFFNDGDAPLQIVEVRSG